MLVVLTTLPLVPDRRDEALALVERLAENTRSEPGTASYWATVDVQDPNVVRFVERYEDVAAAEAHQDADYYREFNERLPVLVDGDIETTQFVLDEAPETHRFSAEAAAESVR